MLHSLWPIQEKELPRPWASQDFVNTSITTMHSSCVMWVFRMPNPVVHLSTKSWLQRHKQPKRFKKEIFILSLISQKLSGGRAQFKIPSSLLPTSLTPQAQNLSFITQSPILSPSPAPRVISLPFLICSLSEFPIMRSVCPLLQVVHLLLAATLIPVTQSFTSPQRVLHTWRSPVVGSPFSRVGGWVRDSLGTFSLSILYPVTPAMTASHFVSTASVPDVLLVSLSMLFLIFPTTWEVGISFKETGYSESMWYSQGSTGLPTKPFPHHTLRLTKFANKTVSSSRSDTMSSSFYSQSLVQSWAHRKYLNKMQCSHHTFSTTLKEVTPGTTIPPSPTRVVIFFALYYWSHNVHTYLSS